MNAFDLQIQTTASDGRHTPREVVQMAAEQNLRVIAITDHDTVDGVEEALAAGGEFGVRVIPGVEMSAEENDIHILGYGFDREDPQFLAEMEKSKQSRLEGARQILDNLRKNEGLLADWEDVLTEAGGAAVITSPHVVYAVMKRPENKEKLERDEVRTKSDFYNKYLSRDGSNYVKRYHTPAEKVIGLIHVAGGIAVWSHPMLNFPHNYEGAEGFLGKLIEWGMDGMEVFSPSHTEDDVEFLLGLVAKHSLLKTAGSDFHEKGQEKKASPTQRGVQMLHSASFVGDYPTYGFSTEGIIEKLDEAIQKRRR